MGSKKSIDRHMEMANKLYPHLVKQVNSRVPKPGIVKRMADAFREVTESSKGKEVDLSGYVRKSDVTKKINKAVQEALAAEKKKTAEARKPSTPKT